MGVNSCGTTLIDNGTFQNIGSVTWDTTAKTSGFTGVAGNGYFVNTTSGSITVTLPSSPSAGDVIGIKDYANTADTNNITIGRNGSNINGDAADYIMNIEGLSVLLVYVDGTKGWLVTNSAQASDITNAEFITATGGTITTDGNFKVHTFTGPGTFTVCSVGNPAGSDSVDYLVVAGGGAGGISTGAGGGGAGGNRTNYPGGTAVPVTATSFPITVGSGGSGGSPSVASTIGSNSIFSTITSAGGGYGGWQNCTPEKNGKPGGSGGGARYNAGASGGSGNTPPVSPPQGNNGGAAIGANYSGAGGGGATAAGSNANPAPVGGGDGGAGTPNTITGSDVSYAGGGGGGSQPGAGGCGGAGGGGNGGQGPSNTTNATAGTANTGGGGGAGDYNGTAANSNGGSGIVIIRYKFQ